MSAGAASSSRRRVLRLRAVDLEITFAHIPESERKLVEVMGWEICDGAKIRDFAVTRGGDGRRVGTNLFRAFEVLDAIAVIQPQVFFEVRADVLQGNIAYEDDRVRFDNEDLPVEIQLQRITPGGTIANGICGDTPGSG